jgi:hypothetical protein
VKPEDPTDHSNISACLLFASILTILTLTTPELEDMEDAYNGFVHKGRTYPE